MNRYINQDKAIDMIMELVNFNTVEELRQYCYSHLVAVWSDGVLDAIDVIDAMLPEDVQPVVHGEWIVSHIPDSMLWECNQCGFDCGAHSFNFCPNCGADMRTKEIDCDYERAVEQLEHDMLYEPTFN